MRPSFFDASHRRGGFTLVELIITVAILGIVAIVAVPKILGTLDSARVNSATTSVVQLQLGLERYYVDNQGYPTSISSFDQLASLVSTYTPVDATPADYSFISYTPYDNKQSMNPCTPGQRCWYYTLAVAAKDNSSTPIQVTPESVAVVDAATVTQPPTAPTQLVATAVSYDTINLSWMGSALAFGYSVHRSDTANFTADATNKVATVGSTVLQYSDTGRTHDQTYYYQVTAVNAAGTSPASTEAAATALSLPPAPLPPNLTQVTAQTDTTIALTWASAASATSYKVKQSTDSNVDLSDVTVYTGTQTAYTATGLQPSTKYWYAVLASNAGGDSGLSNVLSDTTKPAKPQAPTGVTPTALAYDTMQVTWTGSAYADSYNVYHSTDPTFMTSAQVASGVSTTSFTDTGLTPSTVYYYKVVAVNVSGQSSLSDPGSGQTLPPPPAPGKPDLTLTLQSGADIKLDWTSAADAQTYSVYRRSSAAPSTVTRILYGLTGTSVVDSGLAPETTYFYVVSAVNPSGETASDEKSQQSGPAAPTNLAATPASSSKISLTWTPVAGATYKLYRGTSPGNYPTVVDAAIQSPTYVDTGLVSTTTYYYVVAAIRDLIESVFSVPASASTTLPPPTTVTALGQSDGTVQVGWSAVPSALGYKVYRGTTSGFQPAGSPLTTTAPGVTSYTDNDVALARGTTYYYRVTTVDGGVESDPSAQGVGDTAPVPPANVQASAQPSSINLSWTASAGATGYNVYRSGTAPVGLTPVNRMATNVAAAVYSDTNIGPNTGYHYVVTALRNGVESLASSDVPVTTTPGLPTGLVVRSRTNSSLYLTWSAPAGGASTYRVYRSTTTPFTPPAGTLATTIAGTTFTDTGLAANTTYYYRIVAVNSAGDSVPSSQASAKTATSNNAYAAKLNLTNGTPSLITGTTTVATPKLASPGTQSYSVDSITGTWTGNQGTTAMSISINNSGNGQNQITADVKVTYDFYGDGTVTRVESYTAVTINKGATFVFTQTSPRTVSGAAFTDFVRGKVTVDATFTGSGDMTVNTGTATSTITIPYSTVTRPQ